MHEDSSSLIWSFDIRHGAEPAAHIAGLLSAFSLTFIVLLLGSERQGRDKLAPLVIGPFLLAFLGHLMSTFLFIFVSNATSLSTLIFALIIPPELIIMISSLMMLFGIILALMRFFPHADIRGFMVWLFVIASLFSVGILQGAVADLLHANNGFHHLNRRMTLWAGLLTWSPALLVVGEWLWFNKTGGPSKATHDRNLWKCSFVFIIAMSLFGIAHKSFESEVRMPNAAIAVSAMVISATLWSVVGTCFHQLRGFHRLCAEYPMSEDPVVGHGHPPHPPV